MNEHEHTTKSVKVVATSTTTLTNPIFPTFPFLNTMTKRNYCHKEKGGKM